MTANRKTDRWKRETNTKGNHGATGLVYKTNTYTLKWNAIKTQNRIKHPTYKTNTKTQKNIINWTAYQLESTQNIQMQHISK